MHLVQSAVSVQRQRSRQARNPDESLLLHELTLLNTDVRRHRLSRGRLAVYQRTHPQGHFLRADSVHRLLAAVTPRPIASGGWYQPGGYNGI